MTGHPAGAPLDELLGLPQFPFEAVVLSRHGRIADVNDQMCELVGYERYELIDREVSELVAAEDRDLVASMIARNDPAPYEHRVLSRDGGIIYVEVCGRRVSFNGRDYRMTAIRDVTEQKRMEAERLHLEDQLRQSQKMEAVGQLAGGIAHDFNNLLTVILGHVELSRFRLEENAPSASLRGHVTQIEQAARQAANLTARLLAFSRRQVATPRRMDLTAALKDFRVMLRRLIRENIELKLAPARDTRDIVADPVQIQQIVINLVVNAQDAMRDGGRLTLSTSNVELPCEDGPAMAAPGPYVRLSVADTGHGIAPEEIDRIFEPFFTTKPRGQGTGLGLAMVYGIVKQTGGDVQVWSQVGEGTRIDVYLPVAEGRPEDETARPPENEPPRGSGEVVLVCEDDPAVRRLIVRTLSGADYRVLRADSGRQALALAGESADPVDLLVTDIIMPGTDGRELACKLNERYSEVRTLYVSGYVADTFDDGETPRQDIDLLPKPFTLVQLLSRVRSALDRRE